MANNHYIPRFLTEPWKTDGHPLWHFNFTKRDFFEEPSLDTLFAKRNLWSAELETFLNKHTENFSAAARKKLITMREPNPKEFESLFLLILFQAARTGHMKGLVSELENITSFDAVKLGQLAQVAQDKWSLCGIHLPSNCRLFFPDNGVFLFPIQTQIEYKWIFALPMTASFCLALVPNELDVRKLANQIDYSHLVLWSVCSSKTCEVVVIHPDLYHFKNDKKTLANELQRMRTSVDEQIAAINKFNDLLVPIGKFLQSLSD